MEGSDRPQTGNASDEAAPHGIYRCAGEDDWIAVTATTDDEWSRLARILGAGGLVGFVTAAERVSRREELDRMVSDWTAARDAQSAVAILRSEGVPAAVVASSRYLVEQDAQLAARDYWQRVEHPELGNSLYASPPYRIDGERVDLARPPLLGEHTREVLSTLLGRTEQELDDMERAGVFT